jgi:hypothetical protein
MSNKIFIVNWFKKWRDLGEVLFTPLFFVSAIIAGVTLFFYHTIRDNSLFANTMLIVGSLFAGIAGVFFKDEYDELTGKSILEKRGRSALRNLETISTQLYILKTWADVFSREVSAGEKEYKSAFEEISHHILAIELNIASGIEDWVDILSDVKKRGEEDFTIDKKYKEVAESIMAELTEKKQNHKNTNTKNETIRNVPEDEIRERRKTLTNNI